MVLAPAEDGINVNFRKNSACANLGVLQNWVVSAFNYAICVLISTMLRNIGDTFDLICTKLRMYQSSVFACFYAIC